MLRRHRFGSSLDTGRWPAPTNVARRSPAPTSATASWGL